MVLRRRCEAAAEGTALCWCVRARWRWVGAAGAVLPEEPEPHVLSISDALASQEPHQRAHPLAARVGVLRSEPGAVARFPTGGERSIDVPRRHAGAGFEGLASEGRT
eukprot:713812-Prymnesium_polylepis.1